MYPLALIGIDLVPRNPELERDRSNWKRTKLMFQI